MSKQLIVPVPVMLDAQRIYREYLKKEEYPEDLWLSIQTGPKTKVSDWDLNLYEVDGEKKATLYFVIDEETQTEQGFPVELPKD